MTRDTDSQESAPNPSDDDAWLVAPFAWRWWFRYALSAALLVGDVAIVANWPTSEPLWMMWAVTGTLGFYALLVARELGLLLLALAGLGLAWYFVKDFEKSTWIVIFVIAVGVYVGRQIDLVERRMQKKIDSLESQLKALRPDQW